ncbi:Cell division cycle 20.6, cofactor of APC complex [Capsicum baccatum]|uniref:Cell division cycle 20.6, cofactor of APC complex n=1 Tax=Capsicum baccatum TaxID=33114 RepID=A0A2G2VII8_CAPBA|nr:Cell division cycle 20.6, cofactor of APC complex [Capsicum baccatum]
MQGWRLPCQLGRAVSSSPCDHKLRYDLFTNNATSCSFTLVFHCAVPTFLLDMFQSPDGYTVATAVADETLKLWNVFGNPEENKPVLKRKLEPFFDLVQIR